MGRLTPRFVLGTGFFLVMVIVLVLLGSWQLQRLQWKEGIISKISDTSPKSFVPIEEVILSLKTIDDLDFYKTKARGVLHHELSLELIPRTHNGENGSHIYTPMTLYPSGHTLIVNRGWIPANKKDLVLNQTSEEIELLGYIQEPMLPGWVTPDNVTHKQIWYYIDLEAIQEEYAKTNPQVAKKMLPFYLITIGPKEANVFPKPLDPLSMIRNNHLGYALTWFSLAFALIIMYIIYVRKHQIN